MTTDYGISEPCGPPDYEKAPGETIRVTFHWAERLDGETLLTSTYTLPDGLTNVDEDDQDSVQRILVSGGDSVRIYRVTDTITTSGARTLAWTKRVAVREG